MKLLIEEHLPYSTMTIAVLVFFYGIYFTKMLMQKRRGIVTEIN